MADDPFIRRLDHLRRVHFTLVLVSFAILITSSFIELRTYDVALFDARTINDRLAHGSLGYPDLVIEGNAIEAMRGTGWGDITPSQDLHVLFDLAVGHVDFPEKVSIFLRLV